VSNVSLSAVRIQAQIMSERKAIEASYERLPESMLFWCLVDLVDSSNFRLRHGPREGYVRGETFLSLVRAVITPCAEVRLVKEIGDASLLLATSPRPMLESLFLIDQVAAQMTAIEGLEPEPLGVRGGMSFGSSKRLMRRGEDYLGTSIDQLARLMSLRGAAANLMVQEEAFQAASDVIAEYGTFCAVSSPKTLGSDAAKGLVKPIYYRELTLDRQALLGFEKYFVPWRMPSTA
jgi:hypothetical protein